MAEAVEHITTNRKAERDYALQDRLEAGVVLTGTEIKSIRQRHVRLEESFARVVRGEVFLYNCHITPYEQGNRFNVDPTRTRKLLLHRREIERLIGVMSRKGMALVPTKLYVKRGIAKLEVAIAQGKRQYEKRERIRQREVERELQRAVRQKR